MNDDPLHGLFQEMRDEPVPAESLARVRQGVARRIEGRRSHWRWGALAAVVGLGLLVWVAAFFRPREAAPERPAPIPVAAPTPPPVAPPVPAAAPAPQPRPRVVSKAKPKRRVDPMEEVVFRMQTEDPEVVILLVN